MFNVTFGTHENTSVTKCPFHMWEVISIIAKVGILRFFSFLLCNWGYFASSVYLKILITFTTKRFWFVQLLCSYNSAKMLTKVSQILWHYLSFLNTSTVHKAPANIPGKCGYHPKCMYFFKRSQNLQGKSTEQLINSGERKHKKTRKKMLPVVATTFGNIIAPGLVGDVFPFH